MTDEELIDKIKNGEVNLYGVIIQKYNQRFYRIARSILGKDKDLEDILQETYIKGYTNLAQFRYESQFSTWLTRILINTANASLAKSDRLSTPLSDEMAESMSVNESPDVILSNDELKLILEVAVDRLPEHLRSVYVMREIENLNVSETAHCLNISEENVKVRLHRAKQFLKEELNKATQGDIELFRFAGSRCAGVYNLVMESIKGTK